jgi:hypothetical protein
MSPEACESVLLALAAGWLTHLAYRSTPRPRALLFAALYLAVPSVGLALQAAGFAALALTGKWATVAVNAALLVAMVAYTRRADSPTVRALVEAEREMRWRELRAAAYALARVALAEAAAA